MYFWSSTASYLTEPSIFTQGGPLPQNRQCRRVAVGTWRIFDIDAQHQSAFWELYLHELFSRLGLTLEPHPEIQDSRNHPDFLVKEGDVAKFYLEGIVAGLPSTKDAGAEARLAEVFDLVNSMKISDWFLQVEYRG